VRLLAVLATLGLGGSVACWEQWGGAEWFPQMKRQIAVQAFESPEFGAGGQAFSPPEGAVPVGRSTVPLAKRPVAEQEALPNPRPATLASLENGRARFTDNCAPCHGPEGGGNGPIAGPPFGKGPIPAVLPIGGPASISRGLTDGHIFTTMSLGRGRMPSYRRLPEADRWDIVNYVRHLNGQGGRP
jgi:mono/diheme cytochrome c family protein